MGKLVAALNSASILVLLYFLAENGGPSAHNIAEVLFVALYIATPTVTLIYFFGGFHISNWISLYFERRAAEERKKLKELE